MSSSVLSLPRPVQVRRGTLYVLLFALAAPAVHLGLGLALDRLLHLEVLAGGPVWRLAGAALLALGAAWIATAVWSLARQGRGLPISSSPPSTLVCTGPYRFGRHPIYLGAVVAFLGAALLQASPGAALVGAPLLALFYFSYARGIEEPLLVERFGRAYRNYCARTPLVAALPFHALVRRKTGRLLARVSCSANRPHLHRHGEHIVFWGYGLWPGLGVGLGLGVTQYLLLAQGVAPARGAWLVALATAGGLLGARWMWRVVLAVRDGLRLRQTAATTGFVSWGALVGVLALVPAGAWILDRPGWLVLDALLPGLLVAHVFGRIGCTYYGCCYGKETRSRLALRYRHPALKAVREGRVDTRALIPVQPLSALHGALGAALVLGAWTLYDLPLGVPAALCAVLYGLFRLSEEWLRVQTVVLRGGVSPAQVAAVALLVLGLAGLLAIASGSGGSPLQALRRTHPAQVAASMTPVLLGLAALLTAAAFSYHRGRIGRWR